MATISRRREHWAWYLYDFGNSAYAAVVLLAVYAVYFKESVVGGYEGSRLWGIAVGVAMLVVAMLSPILGAVADHTGSKKRVLFGFTFLSVLFTGMLFFVRAGDIVLGMVFFILAEIGYRSAQVFYNSLLPEIAKPEEIGRISGNGWAIGSVGGIVCLVIVLALVMFIGGEFVVRVSFVITAVFFALSAVPLFLYVRERAESRSLGKGENYLGVAFKRLSTTFKAICNYREFVKFIVADLIYNDGIIMAMDFAAIFGAVMYGLEQQQLIIFMIIVQVTSIAGAYLFGVLGDKTSFKRALVISLLLMIAAVVGLLFNRSSLEWFFVIGALAGFALTGVQSVSRTMVGSFSPPGKSAEFYGVYSVTGRTSSFIGPTIYGIIAAEVAIWYGKQGLTPLLAEQNGQRVAMLSVTVFLTLGLFLLLFVNEQEGRRIGNPAGQLPEQPITGTGD
jgi:UMF1 family MFS transporter